ncbi:hypothetical protein BaRGS_00032511 [Batillaria attramentaria]|uniref:Uncharacterized protein n=1 Tax=Batillaria attramentaria TaxID=370345 RepID=A0ABD0JNL7_9CAEN
MADPRDQFRILRRRASVPQERLPWRLHGDGQGVPRGLQGEMDDTLSVYMQGGSNVILVKTLRQATGRLSLPCWSHPTRCVSTSSRMTGHQGSTTETQNLPESGQSSA